MNSEQIFLVLDDIRRASGANAKKEIIREHIDDEDFQIALRLALDPFIVFGVGETTMREVEAESPPHAGGIFLFGNPETKLDAAVAHVLDGLRNRRLTGLVASTELKTLYRSLSLNSQRLLTDILLKDLRCGIGAKTVNAVKKELIPEFSVMLADKLDTGKLSFPVFVEPKFDGMRMVAVFSQKTSVVQFLSRSGKPIETVPQRVKEILFQMHEALGFPGGTVFDGELIGDDFRDTMRKARRKGEDFSNATFQVFDALPLAAFMTGLSVGYQQRREQLAGIYYEVASKEFEPPVRLPPSYRVSSLEEMYAIYDAVRGRGLEGLIIKSPSGRWHKRRHADWMKLKDCQTVDVPVVSAIEGTGKYRNMLGALVVDVSGVEVNVGTGFSDQEREELWFNWQWSPDNVRGRMIEVAYHEKTPDGSLRHPRFERFRDDKLVEEGVGV